jgi:hypothetical protein
MSSRARFPSAQKPPRVPRSTRDDHLQKGYALPAKRGGIGIVMSREGDTATVLIMEELISGCIPLTAMPPVGAVVEVEARGDLMVILDWSDGIAQPVLGDWYFTPAESPGWTEEMADSELGTGEQASNLAPTAPGYLWNIADFKVRPGDVLQFSLLASSLTGSASIQMAYIWAEKGTDPQPDVGEVITYGTPEVVSTQLVEFAATVTVPDTFTGPDGVAPTGRARVGLKFESGSGAAIQVVPGFVTVPAGGSAVGDQPLWDESPTSYSVYGFDTDLAAVGTFDAAAFAGDVVTLDITWDASSVPSAPVWVGLYWPTDRFHTLVVDSLTGPGTTSFELSRATLDLDDYEWGLFLTGLGAGALDLVISPQNGAGSTALLSGGGSSPTTSLLQGVVLTQTAATP